jgi:hypothetical protein
VAFLGDLGEEAERFLNARRALATRQVVGREPQVIEHALLGEHAMPLDHVREPGFCRFARAGAGKVAAVEVHTARPRQETRDRAQQRGLAGPVRPEQRHHLTRADREVDAAQHADLAVAGREPGDAQQRVSRRGRH